MNRVCLRCGHEACEFCGDWCDVILYSDKDQGYRVPGYNIYDDGTIDTNPYPEPCCDMHCVYTPEEMEADNKRLQEIANQIKNT